MVLTFETIDFVIFFDQGNYRKMLFGVIHFLLSTELLFSTQNEIKLINTITKKFLLVTLFILIVIDSYGYKQDNKKVNCCCYLDNDKTYNFRLEETAERNFGIELSSDKQKKALQY